MADILTTIRLQADQYLQEGKKVEDQLRDIVALEEKEGRQVTVTNAELARAAKERNALLTKEKQTLADLQRLKQGAFNPKEIELYNSAISKTQKNIDTLKGVTGGIEKQNSLLNSSFTKLGGVIAAAFSVTQIIAFGDRAVTEYAKAEKAAFQLLGALNGNEAAQRRLLNVARELGDRFAIDDDVITSHISFLTLQGRTESQIRKTIQAAIQLSSVTGEDLGSAIQKLDGTFEGVTGRLGRLDSRINDLTKTQLANGGAVDIINEKYEGFAERGLEGVSGQLQRIAVATEQAEERIGKAAAPIKLFFTQAKAEAVEFFAAIISGVDEAIQAVTGNFKKTAKLLDPKQFELEGIIEQFSAFDEKVLKEIERTNIIQLNTIGALTKKETERRKLELEGIKEIRRLREEEKNKIAELSPDELQKLRESQQKEISERQKANEQLRKFTFDELNKNAELEAANRKLIAEETINNEKQLQAELLQIEAQALQQKLQNAKDTIQPTEDIERQITENLQKQVALRKEINKSGGEIHPNAEDYSEWLKLSKDASDEFKRTQIENAQAVLQAIGDISNEINSLLQAESDNQISRIEERKDAQLEAIDLELEKLEEKAEREKISDESVEKRRRDLLNKRAASEKAYNEQVRAEKKKQAEIDKAIAIFNIILNTARAVIAALATVPPNPFLATLAGAVGAAQLGIATATPIPAFKSGSKKTGKSGLARVGEAGEEIVWMPQGSKVLPANRTQQYGQFIDAMFDNRLDDFINRRYVEPALRNRESVNINFNDRNIVRELRAGRKDSIRIENLHELASMFEHPNPRRAI